MGRRWPSLPRAAVLHVVAGSVSLAVVSAAVLGTSQAAFGKAPEHTGAVEGPLTGTSRVVTTLASTNMVPGDTDRRCIDVVYDGEVPAEVTMYGAAPVDVDHDLGRYLDLTVDEVVIGPGDSCARPRSASTIFHGTLSGDVNSFAVRHHDASTGLDTSFTPREAGESRTYRVTVTLQSDDDAQGRATEVAFVWESTSR